MRCVWHLIEVARTWTLALAGSLVIMEFVNILVVELLLVDHAESQHLPERPVCLVNNYQDLIFDFCQP